MECICFGFIIHWMGYFIWNDNGNPVQPYKDGTHAALYEALRYRTPYQQIQNPAPYQQNTAMNQQTTEMPNRFENQNIDQPFEDRTDY